jgi:drug/metabolite transporter (DMT)-like permease
MHRTAALTVVALAGFAANSVLCRLALLHRHIDAASFTSLRLLFGAVALALLVRTLRAPRGGGSWPSAAALFAYAAAFSFAYLKLGAGLGALILFATVQGTMIGWACYRGHRPGFVEWLGLIVAMAGLVALTLPGLSSPDPLGAGLMTVAGIAWGAYSLRGRGSVNPLGATADNFARTLPFAVALFFWMTRVSIEGVVLAAISGAVTSGACYSLWYAALRRLATTQAAIVQLSVPLLAAIGGVMFLGEVLSLRLAVAGILILGGVAIALKTRKSFTTKTQRRKEERPPTSAA